MSRPYLLDLLPREASLEPLLGFWRAGFQVVGVIPPWRPPALRAIYPFEVIETDWESALGVLPGAWERAGERCALYANPHPTLLLTVLEALEAFDDVPWLVLDREANAYHSSIIGLPQGAPHETIGQALLAALGGVAEEVPPPDVDP